MPHAPAPEADELGLPDAAVPGASRELGAAARSVAVAATAAAIAAAAVAAAPAIAVAASVAAVAAATVIATKDAHAASWAARDAAPEFYADAALAGARDGWRETMRRTFEGRGFYACTGALETVDEAVEQWSYGPTP